jgi:hypothetical protein
VLQIELEGSVPELEEGSVSEFEGESVSVSVSESDGGDSVLPVKASGRTPEEKRIAKVRPWNPYSLQQLPGFALLPGRVMAQYLAQLGSNGFPHPCRTRRTTPAGTRQKGAPKWYRTLQPPTRTDSHSKAE